MPSAVLDGMITQMEQACGPTPEMDSIPESALDAIKRHGDWYSTLLNRLFDAARETTEVSVDNSPFSTHMLLWLRANSSQKSRNAILEFLLHPQVRSFRTRAALGRGRIKRFSSIIETYQISDDGEDIPSVIGIYALFGWQ
ncbi:hypothetical protein V8C35DRAFT_295931 [Trichoderma chlorosporum]